MWPHNVNLICADTFPCWMITKSSEQYCGLSVLSITKIIVYVENCKSVIKTLEWSSALFTNLVYTQGLVLKFLESLSTFV